MEKNVLNLARQIVDKFRLQSIEDVLHIIPRQMCHIIQEPHVFNTFPPYIVQLSRPEHEWKKYNDIYSRYKNEIIPSLSVNDYLTSILNEATDRLPCYCAEMCDVAGAIASCVLDKKVYAIRNINVNYLHLPQRWHCVNATIVEGRIRYFDSSAYAQVLDKSKRKLVPPGELAGFNAADIEERFIVSDNWLQSEPFARKVYVYNGELKDTFYPNPIDEKFADEYLREFC